MEREFGGGGVRVGLPHCVGSWYFGEHRSEGFGVTWPLGGQRLVRMELSVIREPDTYTCRGV